MAPQDDSKTKAKADNSSGRVTVETAEANFSCSSGKYGTKAEETVVLKHHVAKFVPSEEKFPFFEMSILFFASFTSAIPLVGLFPYVAFMVVDLGAADNIDEAGYVSGYLASSFMAGRILSSFYWGHVADKAGRLPVAYISCAAIMTFSLTFGLSLNLWMAVISRFFLGLLNPFNTLTKTLISDICCKKHQAMGMSLATGSWSVGLVIGPALGGLLARPCVQYPHTFGGIWLFETFPYLLPNLVTVVMVAVSAVLLYFYLPETAPVFTLVQTKTIDIDDAEAENVTVREEYVDSRPSLLSVLLVSKPPPSTAAANDKTNDTTTSSSSNNLFKVALDLFLTPKVFRVCIGYFLISVTSIIFDEVFPLWAQSSPSKGGLNMTGAMIGQIGSLSGIPMLITTFFIYPRVNKWLGAVRAFRYAQLLSTCFTASVVCVHAFPHALDENNTASNLVVTVLTVLCSGSRSLATIAYASIFVLTNASVSSEQRGAVNGLSMTIGGVAKALGPVCGSIIFAWSINNGIRHPPFNFTCVFVVCLLIGIGTCFLTLDDNNDDRPAAATASRPLQQSLDTARSTHGLLSGEEGAGDQEEDEEAGISSIELSTLSKSGVDTAVGADTDAASELISAHTAVNPMLTTKHKSAMGGQYVALPSASGDDESPSTT